MIMAEGRTSYHRFALRAAGCGLCYVRCNLPFHGIHQRFSQHGSTQSGSSGIACNYLVNWNFEYLFIGIFEFGTNCDESFSKTFIFTYLTYYTLVHITIHNPTLRL